MIHLDTCALITALTGERRAAPLLRGLISDGIRLSLSTPVLYEWLRGPRTPGELVAVEVIVPTADVFVFGIEEARLAAELYGRVARPRGRELDIAIAACAINAGARLWTLNPTDFADIPGLTLARPA